MAFRKRWSRYTLERLDESYKQPGRGRRADLAVTPIVFVTAHARRLGMLLGISFYSWQEARWARVL